MKKIEKYKIVLPLVLGLYGCMDQKEMDKVNSDHSMDSLVTIVVNSKMDFPAAILRTRSFSNFGNEVTVLPKKFQDTISLLVNENELLTISHKGMQQRDSIFIIPGDTLYLNFSENGSLKKNRVRKNRRHLSPTLFVDQQDEILKKELDSIARLFYAVDSSQTIELSNDWEKITLYKMVYKRDYAKTHQEDLHNLINRKISFFKDRLARKQEIIKTGISRNELFNELTSLYALSNNPDSLFIENKSLFLNDSTKSYPFGQIYLEYAIYNVFFRRLSDRSRSQLDYNQFKIYDSLPMYFDSTLVRYGRMICLREMAEQADSFQKVAAYFNKFNNEYGDPNFKDFFQETYLTGLRKAYTSNGDMNLMSPTREVRTLKNILSVNKGKVIYVDFWASWCAPCIAAMPYAEELRNEYKDKDVYFLYVSTDRNHQKWLGALNLVGLENYSGTHLLLNQESSDFVRDLKIKTIPRYIVFDKNGKLVDQNAPGPKGKEIRVVLDNYLTGKTN